MSHPEKMLNSFEENYGKPCGGDYDCWPDGEKIKHFLLQTHLSYLLQSKKRLEGEIKTPYADAIDDFEHITSFNSALTQQIAVLEQEIKEVESLIDNLK